jgi:hypothetical protein
VLCLTEGYNQKPKALALKIRKPYVQRPYYNYTDHFYLRTIKTQILKGRQTKEMSTGCVVHKTTTHESRIEEL